MAGAFAIGALDRHDGLRQLTPPPLRWRAAVLLTLAKALRSVSHSKVMLKRTVRLQLEERSHQGLIPRGHSSNCGSASAISYQGALNPTKMCSPGRAPGSPSTVPNATSVTFPEWVATSGEPHFLQKHLSRPGEDSYPWTNSRPDVHRNWSGLTIPQVANAAP